MLTAALYTLKSFSLPLKGRFLLMYLHLGQDTIVMTDRILGVFDLDNTTVSKHTRDYLGRAQREGRVIDVTYENDGIEKIYLSQMSPATLLRRVREDNVG